MKIFKAVLFPLVYMIIYYFFQFVFGFLGMFIMTIVKRINGQNVDYVKELGNVLVTAIIISGILSFFIYWEIA